MNSSEHGRLSQNQYIIVSLNFPDSKMGTWVTYCESLDEFYVPKSRYDLPRDTLPCDFLPRDITIGLLIEWHGVNSPKVRFFTP